jgi:hypothetical protein
MGPEADTGGPFCAIRLAAALLVSGTGRLITLPVGDDVTPFDAHRDVMPPGQSLSCWQKPKCLQYPRDVPGRHGVNVAENLVKYTDVGPR